MRLLTSKHYNLKKIIILIEYAFYRFFKIISKIYAKGSYRIPLLKLDDRN